MKKVIALALAVLMLATVAFAANKAADVTPGTTIKISKDNGVEKAGNALVTIQVEDDKEIITLNDQFGITTGDLSAYLLRSVNTTNYSLTNIKYTKGGKSLIESVKINDSEDQVEVTLKDDLTNTSVKDFGVEFKLKGKDKIVIRDSQEFDALDQWSNSTVKDSNQNIVTDGNDAVGLKANLPDAKFTINGTVGYGKVEVSVGLDEDEELENLQYLNDVHNGSAIDLESDIIKFVKGSSSKPLGRVDRVAGAYTADALLTQEYGDSMTMTARVYANDTLYLWVKNTPDKPLLKRVEDVTADLDFFYFNQSNADYITLNSRATLLFNDADEDHYVYEVKNGEIYAAGEFSEDDGCWKVETRKLGQYIVTDAELNLLAADPSTDPDNANPDTGANDVVGIATALAAVALVSAAAISLKK